MDQASKPPRPTQLPIPCGTHLVIAPVLTATDQASDDLRGTALARLVSVVGRVADKSLHVQLQTFEHCVVVVLEQRLDT